MRTLKYINTVLLTSVPLVVLGFTASFAEAQVTITNIPTLGGSSVLPVALNSAGQVAGQSATDAGATHAFLYSNGVIYDLGSLGGDYSVASGINAQGAVVGDSMNADSLFHGFLVSGGLRYDLGTLGGDSSNAKGVNDLTQVVGQSLTTGNAEQHAFLFSNGSMADLGTLGGTYSSAVAINNSGHVTGGSYIQDDLELHAFLYRNGVMTDLGHLGGGYSVPSAINAAGDVVGVSANVDGLTRGFLYSHGTITDIGTLGGSYTSARSLNDSGVVVGAGYTTDDLELHAVSYQNGALNDLGTLGGGISTAFAINNLGEIVGYSYDADFVPTAFLVRDGAMVNLNSLLPADSGWELNSATFINDAGQIVGAGRYNGVSTYYLLNLRPVQQPSNRAPLANAGSDRTVECPNSTLLDGRASSDPDSDVLTYEWREGSLVLGTSATLSVQFSLGVHAVTLTVSDPSHATAQASVNVTVVDHTAPVLTAAAGQTLSAGANGKAAVPNFAALVGAVDNCTAANALVKQQVPAAGTLVGVGSTIVTVTVRDASGNTSTSTATLVVKDVTAPVIGTATVTPNVLNRDGKLIPVTVSVSATDNADRSPVSRIVSITSNAPVDAKSDHTQVDWQITGPLTATLRAELNPKNTSRTYTLVVQCTDNSGNSSTKSLTVTVVK